MKVSWGGERWWWPSCPIHGDLFMGSKKGWVYCKHFGWHPARGWSNGAK